MAPSHQPSQPSWVTRAAHNVLGALRYGNGPVDIRSWLMRAVGALQRKPTVILDADPQLCGRVLAASDTKGTMLETLIATPAWHPIYSIESVDGELWQQLSNDFKLLMKDLHWHQRLAPIARRELSALANHTGTRVDGVVDAEAISRVVLRVLYELLFDAPIAEADETLFYRASIQWRKEIAVKGVADEAIKQQFWSRLGDIVHTSRFSQGMSTYAHEPSRWLSLFAQPFLISPQINISDIFVSVFHFLRADEALRAQVTCWATSYREGHIEEPTAGASNARGLLEGVLLEAIRLRHPFPVLERELQADLVTATKTYRAGTHFFILLDKFKQDQTFDPRRWLLPHAENPYAALPFAAGPRMCVGKPIATELLVEMLASLLTEFPFDAIAPTQGHMFSGRDNDNTETLTESLYQVRVFGRVLRASARRP
ncbi:MAG: cytochrome P450 [Myxococcales bacterium]|nr:cytochrome P450 [Myxococcales bacterium]